MKNICFLSLVLACLLLTQCTPKASSSLEAPTSETTVTMTDAEKEAMKEEIKKELEEEIKKELEEEMAAKEPKVSEEPTVTTSAPSKPAKPAMSPETAQNILQGAWKWERTTYIVRGQGNDIKTPEVIGYSKTAVFKPGNKVDILINNFNAVTYTYKIMSTDGMLFIDFSSPDGSNTQHMEDGPIELEQDYFKVQGGYNDRGGEIEYKRL